MIAFGSGTHKASYPVGTGGLFPRVLNVPGREADNSSASIAEVKMRGSVHPLHQ